MSTEPETIQALTIDGENDISLLEILDHVLNSGVVIHGSLVISLAGVDLVYVGLNVILTSVETALRNLDGRTPASPGAVSPHGLSSLLRHPTWSRGQSLGTASATAPVQSREMLGVRLYWSNLDDPESCLGDAEALKKAALQFHQVLREVLAVTTPIPFRFPTSVRERRGPSKSISPPSRTSIAKPCRAWAMPCNTRLSEPGPTSRKRTSRSRLPGAEYLKRRQQATGRVAAVESKLKSVTADSVREWRGRQERKTHRWFALVPRENREKFLAVAANRRRIGRHSAAPERTMASQRIRAAARRAWISRSSLRRRRSNRLSRNCAARWKAWPTSRSSASTARRKPSSRDWPNWCSD